MDHITPEQAKKTEEGLVEFNRHLREILKNFPDIAMSWIHTLKGFGLYREENNDG